MLTIVQAYHGHSSTTERRTARRQTDQTGIGMASRSADFDQRKAQLIHCSEEDRQHKSESAVLADPAATEEGVVTPVF